MRRSKLSWKPIRRGDTYCASACGRGCTIHEYRDAERKALKLAVRLSAVDTDVKGSKWEIRVFENLGWHFNVRKGAVVVNQHGLHRYTAYLNISGPWGGNKVADATTPKAAVEQLLASARAELKTMVALAERLGA